MMRATTLAELLAGFADASELSRLEGQPVSVTDIELDSRRVSPGTLFLATAGMTHHGLDFAEQAIANGAAAIAWEPAGGVQCPALSVPCVAVDRLASRAGAIAARFFDAPSAELFCVGITGTDGKTSTAYLLAHALTRAGCRAGYMGTIGYGPVDALELASHTTPDAVRIQRWLDRLRRQRAASVVMEVSSHALDQGRTTGVGFHIGVLTNIGRDHLDYHGDLARYSAAKKRLFEDFALELGVINRDDETGARWLDEYADRAVLAYGIEGDAPSQALYAIAREVKPTTSGLSFELDTHAGSIAVTSSLLGRFNIYNLLVVAAVLLHRAVKLDDIADILAWLGTVPGRMEGFGADAAARNESPLVVVDYAHTPQALGNALNALRPHTRGRLHCVFGCGGDRDTGKRAYMGGAAERFADVVVVTDDNPRSERPSDIVADILGGMQSPHAVRVMHDREAAIRQTIAEAHPGDVVLIAGKGHETEQIIGDERHPFSDRGLVAEIVANPAKPAGGAAHAA